jgi:hypothetical protein
MVALACGSERRNRKGSDLLKNNAEHPKIGLNLIFPSKYVAAAMLTYIPGRWGNE